MEDKIVVKWERKKENTIGPQENSELTLIANGLWEQIVSFFPFAVVCNTHSSLYMRKSAVSLELDGLWAHGRNSVVPDSLLPFFLLFDSSFD